MSKPISIISAVALLAAMMALFFFVITAPRRSMDRFLSQIAQVDVGKTNFDDMRARIEHSGNSAVTATCDKRACVISGSWQNKVLQTLHLSPRIVASASIGFDDGIASSIYVILVRQEPDGKGKWRDDTGVVVRLRNDDRAACHPDYSTEIKKRYDTGDSNWATVAMDRCVSRQKFMKAVAINADCLARFGGCKTIEAMLPQVLGHP